MPVLLLTTSGCAALAPSPEEAAAIPPPPPVVEGVPDPIPPPPADGLHRFIVQPPVPLVEPAGEPAGGVETTGGDPGQPTAGPVGSAGPPAPDPAWTLDQSLVDQIDEDTVVVFRDDIPGFVDDEGQFIALVGNSSASSGMPVAYAGELTADEFRQQLVAIDGVVSAVAVGDGTFAVAVEKPEALAAHGLQVTVDVPFALAADPYEYYQWTLDNTGQNLNGLSQPPPQTADADIDGLEAMAGARGDGVVVAIIDTGVDFGHPDLAGQSWVNEDETCGNLVDDDGNGFVDDCRGWDFGYEDDTPFNPGTLDHGTHVAGTVAAVADNGIGVVGMAPEAKIMDLNVQGPGGMTMSGITRAVRYAADNGADIINMSLGTQPGTPSYHVQGLIDAVHYAESKGSLVVVAAGNSSVNLDTSPVWPANIEGPGMITVGASAPDETKASFSNYGSPVDVFAPGVYIVSTVPGGSYEFMNGTSMASPTTAGAAAAVMSAYPDLDPQGVREQLVGTGDRFAAYEDYAANPVRINAAWAVGIDGDPDQAQVTIAGLASATTDSVVADITVSDPGGQYEQPYHWEASLVAIESGQAYGIIDHPVSIDWQPGTTDGRGAIPVIDGGGDRARLETSLPPGLYGLVIEAVPDTDPAVRLGDAFVSTFAIDEERTTTTTAPTATSTTAPATTTSSGGGDGPTTTTSSTTGPTTTTTAPATTTTAPTTTTTWWSTTTASTTTTWWNTTTWSWYPTTTTSSTTAPTTWWSTTTAPMATTAAPTTTVISSTTAAPTTTVISSTTAASTTTVISSTTAAPTTTVTSSTTTATTTVEGGFQLHLINPDYGYVGEQTMVSLTGVFPSQVYVWFGDQRAETVMHTSDWILVVAPPSAQAGTVDVSLRSTAFGTVLLAQDAFTHRYRDGAITTTTTAPTTTSTGSGGETTSTTSSGGGTTSTTGSGGTTSTTGSGGGDGTTSTTGSGGAISTTGPDGTTSTTLSTTTLSTTTLSTTTLSTTTLSTTSSSTTSSSTTSSSTTTSAPPGPQPQSRALALAEPSTLANGLSGVPLQGLDGVGDLPHCISEPCRTQRIGS